MGPCNIWWATGFSYGHVAHFALGQMFLPGGILLFTTQERENCLLYFSALGKLTVIWTWRIQK